MRSRRVRYLRRRRLPARLILVGAALAISLSPVTVLADGWHNAALATSSLDQWVNQTFSEMKSAMPAIQEQIKSGEVQAGRDYKALQERANAATGAKPKTDKTGTLTGKLNAKDQALMGKKAGDCLEILACMNPENIFPAEFPMFQLQQIPRYREAAKSLLKMMGTTGGQAVTQQLRSELMGNQSGANYGLKPHPAYYSDLLEVLKQHIADGTVSLQDLESLEKAAAGMKTGPQAKLAQEIQKTLAEVEDVDVLLSWAEQATDSKRRQQLYNKARGKFKDASVSQLLNVLKSKADSNVKDAASREMEKRWTTAGELELLEALANVDMPQTRKDIMSALAQRSPKYADIKDDLPGINKLAKSSDSAVAAAAREQLTNAFVRAPIPDTLDWLAQGDADLNKLIWEQLDDRISRADAARKDGYRDTALSALGDASAAAGKRNAAIDLLARLKDRKAVGPVIEMIPLMPQDLRPRAGKLLRDLTGQNFGPNFGDDTAKVASAVAKWRQWWKANGGN